MFGESLGELAAVGPLCPLCWALPQLCPCVAVCSQVRALTLLSQAQFARLCGCCVHRLGC